MILKREFYEDIKKCICGNTDFDWCNTDIKGNGNFKEELECNKCGVRKTNIIKDRKITLSKLWKS